MVLNVASAVLALAFSRAAPVAVSPSMAFDTLDTDNLCRVPTEDDTYYYDCRTRNRHRDGSGRLRSMLDDEEDSILTWGSRVTFRSFDDTDYDDATSLEFDHECEHEHNDREGAKEKKEEQQQQIQQQQQQQKLSEQQPIKSKTKKGERNSYKSNNSCVSNSNRNLLTLTPVRKGQIEISLNAVTVAAGAEEEKGRATKKKDDTARSNRKHRTWTTPLLKTKTIMTTILKKSSASTSGNNNNDKNKGRNQQKKQQQKDQHTSFNAGKKLKQQQLKQQHTTPESPAIVKKGSNTKKQQQQQGQTMIRYTYARNDVTTDEESCASAASLPSTSTSSIEGSDDGSAARRSSARAVLASKSKSKSFTKETTPKPTATTGKPTTTNKPTATSEPKPEPNNPPYGCVACGASACVMTKSSSFTKETTPKPAPKPITSMPKPNNYHHHRRRRRPHTILFHREDFSRKQTSKNLAGFEVLRITAHHISITPDEVVGKDATTRTTAAAASTRSSSNTATATAKSGGNHDNNDGDGNGKNDNDNSKSRRVNHTPGKPSYSHNINSKSNNTLPIRTFQKRIIFGSHPLLNNDDENNNNVNNNDKDVRERNHRGKIGRA